MVLVPFVHRIRIGGRQTSGMGALVAAILLVLQPVTGSAWRGVLNDWLDNNRFDDGHSCAALVVADTNVRAMSYPAAYSRLFEDLRHETRRRCVPGEPAR